MTDKKISTLVPSTSESAGEDIGRAMHALATELYPLCRSITGDGVRRTLDIIGGVVPLERREIPTGTPVFDWTVPREWNIRDAYVKGPDGRRVIDFQKSNLHVMGYSVPIRARLPLSQLKEHLFSLPDRPDLVPYKTSYYSENWGFCLTHRQLDSLADGEYEVVIDSTLAPGNLSYGEHFLPGESDEEVLISCHVCHPSLANDNLSSVAVAAYLARHLSSVPRRFSYRFLFIPGTIGSITWLAQNEQRASRVRHGIVMACVGDPGAFTYKKSRRGDADVDRAVAHVLRQSGVPHSVREFSPYGYDERQFCSPGFDLPVGCLMRTPHGEYPEYHTSGDDLSLITPVAMGETLRTMIEIVEVLEHDATYVNRNPKCEPQLGKRGLYRATGGQLDSASRELAMLWVLNLSDGTRSLLSIAERAGLKFELVRAAAEALRGADLLETVPPGAPLPTAGTRVGPSS